MEKIKIEEIEAILKRKKIKNIYISINSISGEVNVSAPMRVSNRIIEQFLRSKLDWIRKHKMQQSAEVKQRDIDFEQGSKIKLFGKEYILNLYETKGKAKIFLNFDTIDLYIRSNASREEKQKAFDMFYKMKLQEIVPEFLSVWSEKIGVGTDKEKTSLTDQGSLKEIFSVFWRSKEDIGLNKPLNISFKKMKSRWGSCNITDRKITLNSELAKKSLRCIEYVTAHEILHIKERKHNKRFKNYMQQFFPDWKKLEKELKHWN